MGYKLKYDSHKKDAAEKVPQYRVELVVSPAVLTKSPVENNRGQVGNVFDRFQIEVLLEQGQRQESDVGDTVLGHAGHKCQGPVSRHGDFGDIAVGFDVEDGCSLKHPGANDAHHKDLRCGLPHLGHTDGVGMQKPGQVRITSRLADEPHEKHAADEVADISQRDAPEKPSPADPAVENTDNPDVHVRRYECHATDHDDH